MGFLENLLVDSRVERACAELGLCFKSGVAQSSWERPADRFSLMNAIFAGRRCSNAERT